MAFSSKSKQTSSVASYIKTYSLPVYIVISAVFILYVLWAYAMGVVYNAGVIQGQEQALQAGQEQGYVAAFQQISEEIMKGCEGVTLTLGDQDINVINTDCLAAPSNDMMFDESAFME